MNSSNPLLNSPALTRTNIHVEPMTIEGTSNKTLVLMLLLFASSIYSWQNTIPLLQYASAPSLPGFFYVGLIGALIAAFATMFKPTWGMYTAPLYAVCEGLAIGAISAFFEFQFPGIVFQAVLGTLGTTTVMLVLYRLKVLRATPAFTKGVLAATLGIGALYLISAVMGLFGTHIPFIHESGPIGIGFSVVVVSVAALNLILDFDLIERGAQARAPKYMEWYCALGLLVTIVWLYLEILRLLSKTRDR